MKGKAHYAHYIESSSTHYVLVFWNLVMGKAPIETNWDGESKEHKPTSWVQESRHET